MDDEKAGIPREFLLKQIENEINTGFALVAAARKAFREQQVAEGNVALERASETHQQVQMHAAETPAEQIRAITHQIMELREAIDWLLESRRSKAMGGSK